MCKITITCIYSPYFRIHQHKQFGVQNKRLLWAMDGRMIVVKHVYKDFVLPIINTPKNLQAYSAFCSNHIKQNKYVTYLQNVQQSYYNMMCNLRNSVHTYTHIQTYSDTHTAFSPQPDQYFVHTLRKNHRIIPLHISPSTVIKVSSVTLSKSKVNQVIHYLEP
jgi:ribonuclease BN (tRNA processing enzyme)